MNRIKTFLGILVVAFAISCEGPQGPPGLNGFDGLDGLDGLDGQDGINILGQVLEVEGTFEAANDYSIFFEFPQSIEVFESDLVLVYILFEQTDDPDGGDPIDVWRLLPQTRILDQGLLQYNYDHTFLDVSIFLESDFDLSTLPAGDTDNQIFRIAVVPAEFGTDNGVDTSNLNAVMSALELDVNSIDKVSLD
ncbi:collagen-like protein [Croceitalea sp. P059]|uniref:collagen-like protein n=1 Tax=Croceitalea sp. P059 TaxID=3075601 RepID=UPI002888D9BB|nr:collagen-like protein [Croceitalea sp. P059]MDT0540881.1 collagen-like protein [Croceitalea sp. P059]